ncbi:MAG: dioxygenase [Deinococcus-Thermus bacterium]|jgi:4,5-DOPA dioxygenase extradiol|nr:dioxygenase [Deinococcota bacterium]
MPRAPVWFVSHGAPSLAIEDGAAHRFLAGGGVDLGEADAVLVVSAHWETAQPTVSAAAQPETIHDFRGFPPALSEIVYPAPGAPDVARTVAATLSAAGLATTIDPDRGLDHGAWVPLSLIRPAADRPVLQLSIQPKAGPAHHLAVGRALAPLRDRGLAILATGAVTHNLGAFFRGRFDHDTPPPAWVTGFADWVAEAAAAGRTDDLLAYRDRAPHAVDNHPSEEHLLPLFVALGAGGAARRVHASTTYGVLAMDVYAVA